MAKKFFCIFEQKQQKLGIFAGKDFPFFRTHRADMDALVTRTLSSCGHGCSGHWHATKPGSAVNTDFLGVSCAGKTAHDD